jgi:hypothetical protein
VDFDFAKEQLLLMLRNLYFHPSGQIPAYEWNFSDVNPPVHAWAALRVFVLDGSTDFTFLARIFHKLLITTRPTASRTFADLSIQFIRVW